MSTGPEPAAGSRVDMFDRLRGNRFRLVLTSSTLLFVELLLIRWIPAEVRYIGFFSNFLLMASFLGIGIGILLGRRRSLDTVAIFPILLLAVVWLIIDRELNVQIDSTDELFFGLAESRAADVNFLVLPLVFGLVTALMASIAVPLGPLLRSMPPLQAYGWDITGSMLGIAGFTFLSALGTDPIVWFAVASVLVTLMILAGGDAGWLRYPAAAALAAVMILAYSDASPDETWSSYYRINSFPLANGQLNINVNGIPHQVLHPVYAPKEQFYDQVYKWFPGRTYPEVLVVGAGSGSDVAISLAKGAGHVDAVEIDRAIQKLGIDFHPDHPYQDSRVTRFVDDGRAYLRGTDKHYDLIIFALPDSLTLVSTTANIRLESFLFTEQAFQSVRDHLTADGVFVVYNYYREEWLISKIAAMLDATFESPPIIRMWEARKAIFAAGPLIDALHGAPPADLIDRVPDVGTPEPKAATDDWPFLYLRTPFIAPHYLAGLGFVALIALLGIFGAARVGGTSVRRFSPHFFVLGTAFLLLETRSLVSFSLLFGSTWLVNALAFFAILASVLLAILVNARLRIQRAGVLYGLLFAALAVAFVLPPESLLIDPPWLRYLLAGIVAFAPVFLANLVFTYSFRDTRTADMAFASNLLGAMAGGAMEYVALLSGYRFLLVAVAVLYLLAWLFATRWRRLADVALASDADTSDAAWEPAGLEDAAAT